MSHCTSRRSRHGITNLRWEVRTLRTQPSPHEYTISPAKRLYYPYPQAKCRNHCRDLPAHCTPPNGASTAPLTRTIYFVQRSSPQPGFSILFLVGSVLHRLTKYLPSMSPLPHPPYNQQPTQQRKPLNAQPFHLISSHLIWDFLALYNSADHAPALLTQSSPPDPATDDIESDIVEFNLHLID